MAFSTWLKAVLPSFLNLVCSCLQRARWRVLLSEDRCVEFFFRYPGFLLVQILQNVHENCNNFMVVVKWNTEIGRRVIFFNCSLPRIFCYLIYSCILGWTLFLSIIMIFTFQKIGFTHWPKHKAKQRTRLLKIKCIQILQVAIFSE